MRRARAVCGAPDPGEEGRFGVNGTACGDRKRGGLRTGVAHAAAFTVVLACLCLLPGPGAAGRARAAEDGPGTAESAVSATAVPDTGVCAAPAEWVPARAGGPEGESVTRCLRRMGRGRVDVRIPADQRYVITTFGGPGDEQPVDCGDPRGADGTWYYAANMQRFPCGQKVRLVDAQRRRCVIVEVADTGPHICVEAAGRRPMWDVSPIASQHVVGQRSTGWSAGRIVYGAPVHPSNALGPCDPQLASPQARGQGSVGGACAGVGECSYEGALCLGAQAGWPGG